MTRRFRRGTVFATLLLWQAGSAFALDGSALSSMPGTAVNEKAAHCHAPANAPMAAGDSTTGAHTFVSSDDSAAKDQPACCVPDSCKCSAAPGGLAVSNCALRGCSVLKALPASVPKAPPITERASSPFRPPI